MVLLEANISEDRERMPQAVVLKDQKEKAVRRQCLESPRMTSRGSRHLEDL